VTQIVIGKSSRSRWFEILHGSVVHDLVRRSGNISVHVIAGDDISGEPIAKKTVRTAEAPSQSDLRPYAFALLTVAAAVGIGMLAWPWIGTKPVDLLLITGVVAVAVRYGLWPSLFASVASALSYNFFFTAPFYTFMISDPTDAVAVVFFFIVAMLVSNVAARARVQAVTAMARARTTELLYAFSRKLAGAGTLDDVLWATAYQAAVMLKVNVVLLLPEDGSIAVKAGYPPEDTLDAADLAAAKWAWEATGRRVAARIHCREPSASSCPCIPAAAQSGLSASTAKSPDRCSLRISGPKRARGRTRTPSRGSRPCQTGRRNGSSALGAADFDFA
jgi:two-component system sensor histidine kinase KdpD